MERATEYQPTRVSHPVESLVEFLAMYPGVPINEPFWRKRIDDYVASVVAQSVMRSLPSGTCRWTEDEEGIWNTECGQKFIWTAGIPTYSGERFCFYCGKSLEVIRYASESNRDEE
jgi:hypothetical protein